MTGRDYNEPEDKKNFVFVIFYWLGIGTLLPWNFFISVSQYWKYKWRTIEEENSVLQFQDVTINETTPVSGAVNDMQSSWNSNLAAASMVPNVTILILNAAFGHRFKTQPRLLISLCCVILLFIFTAAMVKVDTSSWQDTFYIVTLISVVLINVTAAIFQSGLLGIAGKFPPKYMGGVFSGQALGGIFASATNVVFLAMGANEVDAAFYSFIIAVVFMTTALLGYIAITRSDFFKYFVNEDENQETRGKSGGTTDPFVEADGKKLEPKVEFLENKKKVNPLKVLFDIILYTTSVFLIFAVTLGVFPAITASIVSTDFGSGSLWTDKFFIPVSCFLLFNIGDYVGRFMAEMLKFPGNSKCGILSIFLLSLARIVFIPLFVFCNANPSNRNLTGAVIANDYAYLVIMLLFSLSNGYLSCIAMMNAPQLMKRPEEQQTAASLMVAFLGLGLGVGSALSNAFILLL